MELIGELEYWAPEVEKLTLPVCPRCEGQHLSIPTTRIIPGSPTPSPYTHTAICPERGEIVFVLRRAE